VVVSNGIKMMLDETNLDIHVIVPIVSIEIGGQFVECQSESEELKFSFLQLMISKSFGLNYVF
jgi:hypothetical protein